MRARNSFFLFCSLNYEGEKKTVQGSDSTSCFSLDRREKEGTRGSIFIPHHDNLTNWLCIVEGAVRSLRKFFAPQRAARTKTNTFLGGRNKKGVKRELVFNTSSTNLLNKPKQTNQRLDCIRVFEDTKINTQAPKRARKKGLFSLSKCLSVSTC